MIDDCKKDELSFKETVSLFSNMSELRCITIFDLWAAKYANVSYNLNHP
jgi:hypothetical protein